MGGVITTLLVLMLVTNQFKTSKVTKNVLESADAGDAIEAVGDVSSEDFDSILESGNREQLGGILSSLNLSARQQTDVPSQVQFNRRRVSVANRLLTNRSIKISEPWRSIQKFRLCLPSMLSIWFARAQCR
jgi:hypothetical protein